MRLNKFICNTGICSRRKADLLIRSGKIEVNGVIANTLGIDVKDNDIVKYNGKTLILKNVFEYYVLNKPKNFITTCLDDRNRRTVLDLIPFKKSRLYPVGRLDRNTTGLLLLTNDGMLTNKLTHPSFNLIKKYNVILDKKLTFRDEILLKKGVLLEDGFFKFDDFYMFDDRKDINVVMHSGRNRIIRRVFEHLGYRVKELDRYYYAGITKKNLGLGRCRKLTCDEIKLLKSF